MPQSPSSVFTAAATAAAPGHEASHAPGRKASQHASTRTVFAATVGCMLEWYDFAIYGYFAVVISRLFFPVQSEWLSLLLAVATFGVGFVMRPVGAVVLGTLADRKGRRVALSWAIVAMVAGTALIAFAPTYASIGIAAPILIVVARLIQGFSSGGEMGTATSFLIEHAPPGRRILYASLQQLTQLTALLCGSLVGAAVSTWLSPAELESWGWRVPFMVGLLIAPVGWYIRKHTDEPPAFAEALAQREARERLGIAVEKPSAWSALKNYPRESLVGFCITVLWTVCTYFFLIYMPTYAVRELHLPVGDSLISNSVALVVAGVALPLFAMMADKRGPRGLLLVSSALMLLASYPALVLLTQAPELKTLILVQAVFGVLIAAYTAPAGGAIANLFPSEIRSTGISIAYNFAVTVFGGFAPFIATWLIGSTGNPLSPAWYVSFAALVAFLGAWQLGKVRSSER